MLQGFGFLPNTRYIHIAKNNREISDVSFRLQVITTVDQIENMYWDLVYAFENVKVQQDAVNAAQKTLSDSEKQVKFGTLPPIQVVSAQSTVATDEQQLIVAQTNLELLAIADEERAQPHHGRPLVGRGGSDSDFHYGSAQAGTGRAGAGDDQ